MKKIVLGSLVMLFVLTGCNTVKGMGKDVSLAGNAVSNTAEKTQDKIRKQLIFASKPYLNDKVFLLLSQDLRTVIYRLSVVADDFYRE